jgi:membrane protease subunit HflK
MTKLHFDRRMVRFLVISVALAAFIFAGFRVVPQGNRGAVLRFGSVRPDLLTPGMHWVMPWPIGEVRNIPTESVRQIRLEPFREGGIAERAGEFLTGDSNLLEVALRLDYRVADPAEIARTGIDQIENRLIPLAESSLVSTLSGISIAEALGPGRDTLARSLQETIQKQADRQALGIRVVGIVWVELTPPREVRRDFEDAQSAVAESARSIAEAERAAAALTAAVSGETAVILADAETAAQTAKANATAESRKFMVLMRYTQKTGYALTGRELWLRTIDEIMPALKARTVLATDQPVDLTIIRQKAEIPMPPEAIGRP